MVKINYDCLGFERKCAFGRDSYVNETDNKERQVKMRKPNRI
jgi:hypothetical protein